MLKLPPRPCENTTRGYLEDNVLGSSGESGVAGMLVYLIRDGSAEMNDARRAPAPRKDEYASIHWVCGGGSHLMEPEVSEGRVG